MLTIQQMREKHWSEEKSPWPAKRSKVSVPFCWEGFKINKHYVCMANSYAKSGMFGFANYWLTAAYDGGEENDAFWNQFI